MKTMQQIIYDDQVYCGRLNTLSEYFTRQHIRYTRKYIKGVGDCLLYFNSEGQYVAANCLVKGCPSLIYNKYNTYSKNNNVFGEGKCLKSKEK
jgi:hypothetical protein